jgi:hypothetical protein
MRANKISDVKIALNDRVDATAASFFFNPALPLKDV